MFIPRYWSEASHRERFPGRRQVTVRRFGWSSESQAAADAHARQRVEEALAALAGAVLLAVAARIVAGIRHRLDGRTRDLVRWAVLRCKAWCREHPDWRVVVYETAAGARLLPVHAAFDAGDEATFEFMDFVRSDPLYQRMCRLQRCFRARVSPKPWRAGVSDHFRAGGTWPVQDPAKLAARAEWTRRYEQQAQGYASCRIAETIGEGRADPSVEEVRRLHDELSRASSGLPLA